MEEESAIACMAALSHGMRLKIFRFLIAKGPSGARAGEISDAVEVGATTASFHFKELYRSGLIVASREGRFIRYAVHIETVRRLFSYVLSDCCDGNPKRCGSFIEQLGKELERFDK
jgi:ArsR family transcriptional regulator, arsenate/arsenite/antimonite-responsive transcriptional repressor